MKDQKKIIEEIVARALANVLGEDTQVMAEKSDTSFNDLGIDSLDVVNFQTEVSEELEQWDFFLKDHCLIDSTSTIKTVVSDIQKNLAPR